MTALTTYFDEFLSDIRPQREHIDAYREGHLTLRERMRNDDDIATIRIGDFLQGSYRRSTAIKPENGQRSDVDVVIVTNLSDSERPSAVYTRFRRFLDQFDDYKGKLEKKTHAIGISLDEVEIDLVITSAPSESTSRAIQEAERETSILLEDAFDIDALQDTDLLTLSGFSEIRSGYWRSDWLRIANFDTGEWDDTDPLTQIAWTTERNKATEGHYVNVVKALKWWRRTQCPTPKHPKGYLVEHIIGDFCLPPVPCVGEGVVRVLEGIRDDITLRACLERGESPCLPDRGIPDHNVWHRIEFDDFEIFMEQVGDAAVIAREALDATEIAMSAARWHDLFGDPFHVPEEPEESVQRFFHSPGGEASPPPTRWG